MLAPRYRYGADNVLFPFGYGLSYARFTYKDLAHPVGKLATPSAGNYCCCFCCCGQEPPAPRAVGGIHTPLCRIQVPKPQAILGPWPLALGPWPLILDPQPSDLCQAAIQPCDSLNITVAVSSSRLAGQAAAVDAAEVVQVYLSWDDAPVPTAAIQLVGFAKVLVPAGGQAQVTITLLPRHYAVLAGASTNRSVFLDVADENTTNPVAPRWEVAPGSFTLWVGGQQPRLNTGDEGARSPSNVLKSSFTVASTAAGGAVPLSTCPGGTPS